MKRTVLTVLLIVCSLLLIGCQSEKTPATPKETSAPAPTSEPVSSGMDIVSFMSSDLGSYSSGDAQKLASLPSGVLYTVYVGGELDSTGVFLQNSSGVQLVGECGGKWTFEAVSETLEYPSSLYVANFDYGGIDAVDKFANIIFVYESEKTRFAPYLTKSCSNVLMQEEYQGVKVAWVFWSDDTNVDPVYYLIPFNLVTGEKYGRYAAQYKELTTLITMNKPGVHLVSEIAFVDETQDAIRITRSMIDGSGTVLDDETFVCDTYTGEFSH